MRLLALRWPQVWLGMGTEGIAEGFLGGRWCDALEPTSFFQGSVRLGPSGPGMWRQVVRRAGRRGIEDTSMQLATTTDAIKRAITTTLPVEEWLDTAIRRGIACVCTLLAGLLVREGVHGNGGLPGLSLDLS